MSHTVIRSRVSGILTFSLLTTGLIATAVGWWIPAKAALAQVLLDHAWHRARAGEEAPKPWTWADTWPVARLTLDEGRTELIVLSGTSGHALAFGPGHLEGSALPGHHGHSIVAAHRDTHFAAIRNLRIGQRIAVERVDGEVVRYKVTATRIIDEHDGHRLRDQGDRRISLVTCYPFDAVSPGGSQRWVVTAVEEKPATLALDRSARDPAWNGGR